MQEGKIFGAVFCVMLALFFLPTALTWDAPMMDGQRHYGFPLIYYAWGGDSGEGACARFSWPNLALDLALLLGLPALCSALYVRLSGRRAA